VTAVEAQVVGLAEEEAVMAEEEADDAHAPEDSRRRAARIIAMPHGIRPSPAVDTERNTHSLQNGWGAASERRVLDRNRP
jgi:hypothetical protein